MSSNGMTWHEQTLPITAKILLGRNYRLPYHVAGTLTRMQPGSVWANKLGATAETRRETNSLLVRGILPDREHEGKSQWKNIM
ncbi:hypothetical protein LSAT2_029713 [Lamellibrachia satsuma]|nr:hypothetical protein LSAT2_029713 [Lamellibrachia satsuma]